VGEPVWAKTGTPAMAEQIQQANRDSASGFVNFIFNLTKSVYRLKPGCRISNLMHSGRCLGTYYEGMLADVNQSKGEINCS